jgi:hypothetical protein
MNSKYLGLTYLLGRVLGALLLLTLVERSNAQWVAYSFNPRAAYLTSYGLDTNSNNNVTNILTKGWPTNAQTAASNIPISNSLARATIALYFSTNTNSPNFITAIQPLFWTYTNSTNVLSISNYATNFALLNLTNTNAQSLSSTLNTNIWFYNRTLFGTNYYLAGQFVLSSANTNAVGTFNAVALPYLASQIGTNNWTNAGGTNYLPSSISLKIQALSFAATNQSLNATNQQLNLPLTIDLTLTKALNNTIATNVGAFTSAYPSNLSAVISNLPLLIRSNGISRTNTTN